MTDFYEIDFLAVEAGKSGDAIAIRYRQNGVSVVQVVDGGFTETGDALVRHLRTHYDTAHINYLVLTHPDNDHALGLLQVVKSCTVDHLIMNRPWIYAEELIGRTQFGTVASLEKRLRDEFPHSAALEELAIERGIPIHAGFTGTTYGEFKILAPTQGRYLELVLEASGVKLASVESHGMARVASGTLLESPAAWGEEVFSPSGTGPRNEMSIVQVATLAGQKIMLTGDAGRESLREAVEQSALMGYQLPGIDVFQVPHHGSRRNLSTELLDNLLGPRLPAPAAVPVFQSYISSARADPHHPRKAVLRAMHHRGGRVVCTEGKNIRAHKGASPRPGYVVVTPVPYPRTQETD